MHKQYIQVSVFDRLDSGTDSGILGGRASDIQVVKEAVLQNVENLLNTRRAIIGDLPEGYRHLNDSLFVYGLEDFVTRNPKSPDVRKALQSNIISAIDKFEPRLKQVSVEFNNQHGNEQKVCFTVTAILYADPVHEPIHFDTWFSVNRGEYYVK